MRLSSFQFFILLFSLSISASSLAEEAFSHCSKFLKSIPKSHQDSLKFLNNSSQYPHGYFELKLGEAKVFIGVNEKCDLQTINRFRTLSDCINARDSWEDSVKETYYPSHDDRRSVQEKTVEAQKKAADISKTCDFIRENRLLPLVPEGGISRKPKYHASPR